MAVPSNLSDGGSGRRPQLLLTQDRTLGRRQARRMSRRFARVGVGIPPARLREIAAGADPVSDEATDVRFALAATEMQREQRAARFKRSKKRGIQLLIVAGLILATLNLIACAVYIFVSVLLHESAL
jgi:hypothetical protein